MRRGKELVYFDKSLRSQRYVPPTSADDGVMSPVIARLCLFNENSDNAQYVDSYGVSSYLAKYVTDIDKVAKVYTRAPPYRGDGNMERLERKEIGNTKITSVSIYEHGRAARDRRKEVGRFMSQPEALMLHFGVPPVITDIEWIHISTIPLEEWPGLD